MYQAIALRSEVNTIAQLVDDCNDIAGAALLHKDGRNFSTEKFLARKKP